MSYIFWLANKGYIEVFTIENKIHIQVVNPNFPNVFMPEVNFLIQKYHDDFNILMYNSISQKDAILGYLRQQNKSNYWLEPEHRLGNYLVIGLFFFSFVLAAMFAEIYPLAIAIAFSIYLFLVAIFFHIWVYFINQIVFLNPKGKQTLKQILAFELYLKVAERDKLSLENSLQSPRNSPQTYLDHLPYSVAFGQIRSYSSFVNIYSKQAAELKQKVDILL
jgi:hypothetical protein